jgi:hypothetical protein
MGSRRSGGCRIHRVEEIVHGPAYINKRVEALPIQTHDVELDCNEFQGFFDGNDDADGNAGMFYDMFLHLCLLRGRFSGRAATGSSGVIMFQGFFGPITFDTSESGEGRHQ